MKSISLKACVFLILCQIVSVCVAQTVTYDCAFYGNIFAVEIPVGGSKLRMAIVPRGQSTINREGKAMISGEEKLGFTFGSHKVRASELVESSSENTLIHGSIGREYLNDHVLYIDLLKREVTIEPVYDDSEATAKKWMNGLETGGTPVFLDTSGKASSGSAASKVPHLTDPSYSALYYAPVIFNRVFPQARSEMKVPTQSLGEKEFFSIVRGNFGGTVHSSLVEYSSHDSPLKGDILFGFSLVPSHHFYFDFGGKKLGYLEQRGATVVPSTFLQLLRLPARVKGDKFFILDKIGDSSDWSAFQERGESCEIKSIAGVAIADLYQDYKLGRFDRLAGVLTQLIDDYPEVIVVDKDGQETGIPYGW